MEKYCKPDSPHDNVVEAHCRPNTYGYKHKLRICNSYCFSTATTVAQMRLNIVLYIQRPSCSNTFTRQLHEATIFASSCLSVHLSAWNTATLTRQCLLNLIFVIFAEICQHISALVESNRPLKWTPTYTGCPRRNVPDFGRVFLMLKYTDITQNTYTQSWTVTEITAREVWNFDSCYTLVDYQIHIKTGRNMWFL